MRRAKGPKVSDKPRSREQVSGKRAPSVHVTPWGSPCPIEFDNWQYSKEGEIAGERFYALSAQAIDDLWVRVGEHAAQMIFVAGARRYSFTVGSRSGRAKVAMTVDFVEPE